MKQSIAAKIVAACALFTGAGSVFPHVVLLDGAALAGASYRAAFRVGHGCEGSPTTAITVTIPAGFNGAQPMPKVGWKLQTKVGTLATPYTSHGKTYTEGVQEISWTAIGVDNALPADYYDEFILRGTTPAKTGPIWFKVVQTCTKGTNAWVEIPASGSSTKGLKSPAALLDVIATGAAGEHTH